MNERIHRCLDGELPAGELTPEELREVEAYHDLIRHAAALYRTPEVPELAEAVMQRIGEEEGGGSPVDGGQLPPSRWLREIVLWAWRPRPIPLRPAYGLAAAAALGAVLLWTPGEAPSPETPATPAEAQAPVFVQFRLDAPGASSVGLAGSFTEWQPRYQLNETAPGVWSILIPLPPGIHDYAFVVNGQEWRPDPAAPRVDDGFGGQNSRLAVLSSTGLSL